MLGGNFRDIQASYDRVAEEYVARISGELAHKPLDRQLLDAFAARVRVLGPACDLGCGPGHVTRYLHERGLTITGIDLSPAMVEAARRLNPEVEFSQVDFRALPFADGALGGIVAFYSVIHLSRAHVVAALVEMKRVLRPGGLVLVAFHVGQDVLHLDEWWGQRVSIDFVFFRLDEMANFLTQAGLMVVESFEREPYPDVEHPSRRAYFLAEKPAA
jgi:SAM-dependent methyltransferase